MTTTSQHEASTRSEGSAGEVLSAKRDEVRERAGDVQHEAQQRVAEVSREAREQTTSFIDERRHLIADKCRSIADAFGAGADHLDDAEEHTLADYADMASERLQRLGSHIDDHDAQTLLDDVQGYARRQPLGFLAGAVALGVLTSRLFKASSEDEESEDEAFEDEWDEGDVEEIELAEDEVEEVRSAREPSSVPQSQRDTAIYGSPSPLIGSSEGPRSTSYASPTPGNPIATPRKES